MFRVLHSGAGAGKTHALVKHYLERCLAGDDAAAYRRVLALTFTTKAAGEMRERVIGYLERIAGGERDDGPIADVLAHLSATCDASGDVLRKRAEAVLTHMLHHWGEVAISTIDAFTRRVVKPFARDLQLDHDLRMATDQAHYLERAVDELIAQAGVEPTITGLLTRTCLRLLEEEKPWDPAAPLNDLAQELVKERSYGPLLALRELHPDRVVQLEDELRAEIHRFQKEVRHIGAEALRTVRDAGLSPEDLPYGARGIHNWFRKLSLFVDDWPQAGPNVLKPIESGTWHSGKASPQAKAAAQGIGGALTAAFQQANTLMEQGLKTYLVRRAVARDLLTTYTLHALDERLDAVKRADGVAFFGDLTRKVAEVVAREPVPFIHERMGERYRHFLIDEFQDTSLLQWYSLLPLIDEALSSGGSALLVGDAKQAIYRWRNGEVRLFRDLPALFGRDPKDREMERREQVLMAAHKPIPALATNHRSASTIVEFNNRLFAELAALLPEDLRPIYHQHAQQHVRTAAGLVELVAFPPELKGEERTMAHLERMVAQVRAAVEDGFAPGDIAVLVRTGRQGALVAAHLAKNGYAVVSPDGLKLAGDPLIDLLIDLLRTIHGHDQAAATRAWQRLSALQHPTREATFDPFAGMDQLPDPVGQLHHWLNTHGAPRLRTTLGALIADLARHLGVPPAEDARLLALLDEAHTWSAQFGQDIGGFLAHWDDGGGDRGISPPSDGAAVQVMTVHKSKGLQFPVVIVPFGTGGAEHHVRERFWVDASTVLPDLPKALVRESTVLREVVELPELVEESGSRALDGLNLLYVALTRPEQRLHVGIPGAPRDPVTQHLLAFVEQEGTEGILRIGERQPPWKHKPPTPAHPLRDVSGPWLPQGLVFRQEAPEHWDPADPDPHRSFGNAVHDVMARVGTPDDLPDALRDAAAQGMLSESAAHTLAPALEALLRSSDLAPWFAAGLKVRTEATIIDAEGHAWRPDRVVQDGDVLRILDIKTGAPSEHHHRQVERYAELLREMGHARVEAALLYLPQGAIIPILP